MRIELSCFTRPLLVVAATVLVASCIRPTDSYDVSTFGDGTDLGDVLSSPEPRAGRVELVRYRLWGPYMGLGITGLFGDEDYIDGSEFIVTNGEFGTPPDPLWDHYSPFLSPGPELPPGEDACITRVFAPASSANAEWVNVGDRVSLTGDDFAVHLERDPASLVRPAGESWFVGYGGRVLPVIEDNELLADTWRSGAALQLSAPGAIAPPEATFGAVPFPFEAEVHLPPSLDDVAIDGFTLFKPAFDDDTRYDGPWEEPIELTWTPSEDASPMTVTLRLVGGAQESQCDWCEEDACPDGTTCDEDGWCIPDHGSGWNVLGEVTCTVADDGECTLSPDDLVELETYWPVDTADGALLFISRIEEDLITVPDVRSWHGDRIPVGDLRFRATDTIVSRLELP